VQCAAIEAGGQDHALAHPEAHLARREVGDEHDAAADQFFRLAVAGADAGEDLARAEVAGVELEAQQLVRAFDEFAREHLADAQVELREIVDRDGRGARGCRWRWRS
jgi:hypothetical protein